MLETLTEKDIFLGWFIMLYANVAQLVEQVIRNDQVVGSNPTIGSILLYLR